MSFSDHITLNIVHRCWTDVRLVGRGSCTVARVEANAGIDRTNRISNSSSVELLLQLSDGTISISAHSVIMLFISSCHFSEETERGGGRNDPSLARHRKRFLWN